MNINLSPSLRNTTFIDQTNKNSFNVLSDLEDTEMKDVSINTSKSNIEINSLAASTTSISSGSTSPDEFVPKDYVVDASINAYEFNDQLKNTITQKPLQIVANLSNDSSVDSSGDSIMKDMVASTPKKHLIPVSDHKNLDFLDESSHEYNIEDITDQKYLPYKQKVIHIEEVNDDDPLNVLERQLVTKPKNLHVVRNINNKQNDSPNSINVLDKNLITLF